MDEHFFLSLLKSNYPNYQFTDIKVMYSSFLTNTIQKSPMIFNRVIKDDIDNIKDMESFFLRKVGANFSLKAYKPRKKLFVVYIGTETNQDLIIFPPAFDIIIITAIKPELIKRSIFEKAIYVINIIYKFLFETILSICNEPWISNWNTIIFTTGKFMVNSDNELESKKSSLPSNKLYFNPLARNLTNPKHFRYLHDSNGNLAFVYEV